ncbi:hypothetical protein MUP77_13665, partial [Candidatus Bathyarchaeota archaeon]|nr:hypothetical protein [Candidatus Bathyarchaeota archaeon]
MGKRGRPRKVPTQEPENIGDDGEGALKQDLNDENPTDNDNSPEASLEETITDNPRPINSEQNPPDTLPPVEVPKQWRNVPILELGKQGWSYRRKPDKKGIEYMHIRNRTNERGLGRYTPEREKLFFQLYPIFYKPKSAETESSPEIIDSSGDRAFGKKPFFNVPIKRVAVIPGDYRPTMEVIRYFHTFKNNDFPGDFSDFVNGIIFHHFVKCNGIALPVYINEELMA